MARSKLREDQFRDEDVLTEYEHSNTSHYFTNLADTPATFSGFAGRGLRVKNDGSILEFESWDEMYPLAYSPPSGTLNVSFTGGYSEPAADDTDFIFSISYDIASGDRVFVNSKDKEFAVNLPSSPTMGDLVSFIDGGGNSASNNITISGSGHRIMGSYNNYVIDTNFESFDLLYYDTSSGWIVK